MWQRRVRNFYNNYKGVVLFTMIIIVVFLSVPSGLKIESLGSSWILLSWKLNDARESYIVSVSDGDTKVNYTVDGTHNSLNITGLKGNTEYNLSVIAVWTSKLSKCYTHCCYCSPRYIVYTTFV